MYNKADVCDRCPSPSSIHHRISPMWGTRSTLIKCSHELYGLVFRSVILATPPRSWFKAMVCIAVAIRNILHQSVRDRLISCSCESVQEWCNRFQPQHPYNRLAIMSTSDHGVQQSQKTARHSESTTPTRGHKEQDSRRFVRTVQGRNRGC